jgi:large subunit ribosomal protein L24
MEKIRKGDDVVVIAGKDKGKRGTVLRRTDAEHVLVAGVNRVKKHVKPNPVKGVVGGIIEKEMPLHVSNVRSTTRRPKKRIVSASGCLKTVRRCAFSSRTAKCWGPKEQSWRVCWITTRPRWWHELDRKVRLQVGHGSAAYHQGDAQHGCG